MKITRFCGKQITCLLTTRLLLSLIVNHRVYDCQHGVDRHLSVKKKSNEVSKNCFRVTKYSHVSHNIHRYNVVFMIAVCTVIFPTTLQVGDHSFKRVKKGSMVQESRKLNCKAQVHMRECIKFPGFQVPK